MNIETLAPHALPLAMGLAGAALYHLIGPMLRGTWSILYWCAYKFESIVLDMWGGARYVVEADGPYIAYGSTRVAGQGRPCPKPTKDLRPGDEVSIRARVTTVGENRIHLDAPKDTPNAYLHVAVDVDELNKIRIDNK